VGKTSVKCKSNATVLDCTTPIKQKKEVICYRKNEAVLFQQLVDQSENKLARNNKLTL
jgi:hypothetical protein